MSSEWIGEQVSTLFYQGMGNSQVQLVKYTGKRGFIATTGEHIILENAFDVIQSPVIGQEIDEVQLKDITKWRGPLVLIQHQITSFYYWYKGINIIPSTEKNSNETVQAHSINLNLVSVAQEVDIESHNKKYQKTDPSKELILFGVSRGAATTFNAFCTHKYLNVKLVILEGCFYTVSEVFNNRYGIFGPFLYYGFQLLTSHKNNGPSPATLIDEFPENVPIAFITSKIDTSVHKVSTDKVAYSLAKRGKNPVYLLVLENSSHPNYMFDDPIDTKSYRNFIHALYKKYNLPHISDYAVQGKELIDTCLITI